MKAVIELKQGNLSGRFHFRLQWFGVDEATDDERDIARIIMHSISRGMAGDPRIKNLEEV